MMLAKIKSKLSGFVFAARNLSAARRLVKITSEEVDGLLFRGYSSSDVEAITKIYQQLNEGAAFSWMLRSLYSHIGRRCLLVVEQRDAVGTSKIVGMNMYYLNQRDIKENTIHEGFIGVLPEMGGRGIATKMRQTAINNFKLAGFSGISSRISLNNTASLMSAKKIGFQPVEEYQEPSTGEKRYYMICKF
ncbi:GNAT family N-acetyltransferase [Comamonas avium]|nr:GNAT family N-acetyltransferase [Comamonas avium]